MAASADRAAAAKLIYEAGPYWTKLNKACAELGNERLPALEGKHRVLAPRSAKWVGWLMRDQGLQGVSRRKGTITVKEVEDKLDVGFSRAHFHRRRPGSALCG